MRVLPLAVVMSLVATLPTLAALPPQYQRQAELAAIINEMSIVEAFGFSGIEGIELVAPDHYQVHGANCVLDVEIKDAPSAHDAGWAGPREFILVVGTPVCSE